MFADAGRGVKDSGGKNTAKSEGLFATENIRVLCSANVE